MEIHTLRVDGCDPAIGSLAPGTMPAARPSLTVTDSAAFPNGLGGAVVVLGNFDGVHLGHRELIRRAARVAAAENVPLGVLTFEPHPRTLFAPGGRLLRISSASRKCELLGETGIDFAVVEPFTAALASCGPEEFVREYLVRRLRVGHVFVGDDYRFGHRRAGDLALLRRLGTELGFAVTILEKLGRDGTDVSSTHIRDLLSRGDLDGAVRLLGRDWAVGGKITCPPDGDDGRMGVRIDEADYVRLPPGYYSVSAKHAGRRFDAVAVVSDDAAELTLVMGERSDRASLRTDTPIEIAFRRQTCLHSARRPAGYPN